MCQVLSIPEDSRPQIGRHADFFGLGGDSILAVRLVVLLQARGLQGINVGEILQNATIERIARRLQAVLAGQESHSFYNAHLAESISSQIDDLDAPSTLAAELRMAAEQCGVAADEVEDMYPLTSTQEILIARMVQFSFRLPHLRNEPMDIERLRLALQACVARFPILRTRFVRLNERLLQVVLKPSHTYDQLIHDHRQISLNTRGTDPILGSVPHWFGLGEPAADGGERSCRLTWTLSHGLYDGWSMQLMM